MVDCYDLYNSEGFNNKQVSYEQFTKISDKKWLCPHKLDSLEVRGSYGEAYYDYVSIVVAGCNLGDECMSDEDV